MDLDRLLDKYVIEETIDDYYCSKWYLIYRYCMLKQKALKSKTQIYNLEITSYFNVSYQKI